MPLGHLNQALRKLPSLVVCVFLLLGHTAQPVLDEEPFGIALEGFAYPYPVHMFVIPEGGERLNMAYMDVAPEGDSNGRTALLLHGRNFPSLIHLEAPQRFNESVVSFLNMGR